jgi:hypothetical protein
VTQDLIDADGNRVIEVGEITIRVGRGSLRPAGERPERSEDDGAVTIEHADAGTCIVMKSDGSVEIKADNILFEANNKITMRAQNVDVEVSGTMDVRGQ